MRFLSAMIVLSSAVARAQTPAAPAPAAPFELQPVKFAAANPERSFLVIVDGEQSLTCRTPCELKLSPGAHAVRLSGTSGDGQIFVDGPATVKVERSWAAGLVVGALSVGVGLGLTFVGSVIVGTSGSEGPSSNTQNSGNVVRAAGLGLAVIGAAAGFWIAGQNQLTYEPDATASAEPSSGIQLVALGATPARDGGAMLGVTFAF
jgi:hypothetical protein